jgi:WD40 repeat protein
VKKELVENPDVNLWEPALAESLQEYLDRLPKVIDQRKRLERLQKDLTAIKDTHDGKGFPEIRRRLQRELDAAGKELDRVQAALRVQLREALMKHVEERFSKALGVDDNQLKAIDGLIRSMSDYAPFLQSTSLTGELREESNFTVNCKPIACLSYTGDGRYLVGSGQGSDVFLWDARKGTEVRRIKGHESHVIKVDVCAGTQQVVSCSADGNIRIWSPETLSSSNMTAKHWQEGVQDLAVSASGDWLTFRTAKGELQCWQIGDENELSHAWTIPAPANCKSLCVAPDQRLAACLTGNKSIEIYNGETGKKVRTLEAPESEWTCVAFLPHSEALVIGSKNGAVTYYEVENWQKVGQLKVESSWPVSFSISPHANIIGVRQADGKASLAPLSVQTTSAAITTYSSVEVGNLYPNHLHLMPERCYR